MIRRVLEAMMKAIEISTEKNIEECTVLIKKSIVLKQKSYVLLTPSIFHKDEIVGNVIDNKIWLQKTRPKLYSGVSRMFVANIVSENGNAIIKGRFEYPIFYKILSFILCAALVAVMFFTNLFSPEFNIRSIFAPLIFVLTIYGFFFVNTLIHKTEEREIMIFIRFLFMQV
ncbi:MAG: hypothetical protein VB106_16600 [Clostridiaceae bacterium]|nr:hypothetical protein [Clostridiaceae bacterium]